jgi:phosphatidylinositol alpha-mannosyltransferase
VSLSWWLYRKVRSLLQEEDFDIIHLHEPMAPILPLCVLEFSHAVNVGTFHATNNNSHLYKLSQPITKRWHQRLHGGIAVSPAARRYVNNTFPGEYKIIPNGIDLDQFTDNAEPWPQYRDGKTNILFVGRLEKRKGLKYLLEAYSKLKWEFPDIRLLVVGPGNPDKDSHRILGAQNLQDVEFIGPVSQIDLPRYYASADIFCSPATGSESFGIVLLEAMAMGKPVVASNLEGYASIVSDGKQGILFPPKNGEALAAALSRLVRDPELRRQMGGEGRLTVDQYRWEEVARQVEEYYYQCLDSANGHFGARAV